MTSELVLGHPVVLELLLSDAALQQGKLTAKFNEMATLINAATTNWTAEQADVFRLTDRLTIFRSVQYRGKTLTRSFMAQKERTFYWTFDEFLAWDPPRRRPTAYFHDAWHVHQYLMQGEAPDNDKVLIDREQDAMIQQLEVARVLGCDQGMIDWLTAYANDRDRIKQRLRSGMGVAGGKLQEHFLILE